LSNNVISFESVNDGIWHHAVCNYDRSDKITLYLDNVYQDDANISGFLDMDNEEDLYLGRRSYEVEPLSYTGDLDVLMIFDKLLSADERNYLYGGGNGVESLIEGAPIQSSNPSPVDDATDVAISVVLSWLKDSGDNVLVYLDKKSENDPPTTKVIDDEEAILYDPPGDLAYGTTYVWRVDTKNEEGTTTGNQWEFTTVDLELEIVLAKGNNLLGTLQITNPQIIGEGDFSDSICPQGQDCDDKCSLTNTPNEYHPGTEDSVINF